LEVMITLPFNVMLAIGVAARRNTAAAAVRTISVGPV
jgi:hypothetical protein